MSARTFRFWPIADLTDFYCWASGCQFERALIVAGLKRATSTFPPSIIGAQVLAQKRSRRTRNVLKPSRFRDVKQSQGPNLLVAPTFPLRLYRLPKESPLRAVRIFRCVFQIGGQIHHSMRKSGARRKIAKEKKLARGRPPKSGDEGIMLVVLVSSEPSPGVPRGARPRSPRSHASSAEPIECLPHKRIQARVT